MKIVIIEDEVLTAEDLAEIIGKLDPAFTVTALLHSVAEATRFFLTSPTVDLIFSDIQLGDGLSFEIFNNFTIDTPVIFCTAYDEYALEAIKNNAIEYVLKPFTTQSVAAAIEKYRQLKNHFTPVYPDYEQLIHLITGKQVTGKKVKSMLVHYKDKVFPVNLDDIAMFYIDGDVTRLHCFNGKTFIIAQSLDELESLSPEQFFRTNRQYLINRRAVLDATHYPPRKYVVNLSIAFKEAIVVSKNRTTAFLQWLTH